MTNPLQPTDSPAGIADGEIEELIRLEAEATPGPWFAHGVDDAHNDPKIRCKDDDAIWSTVAVIKCWDRVHQTLYFIVAMRNAIKPLIARLKRAEAERDRLWKQHMTLISHDNAERRVLQLESERDRLREALRPFAEIVYTEDVCWLKDEYKLFAHGQFRYHLPGLTVGTLRAACDAYSETAAAALADKGVEQ